MLAGGLEEVGGRGEVCRWREEWVFAGRVCFVRGWRGGAGGYWMNRGRRGVAEGCGEGSADPREARVGGDTSR